jgi:hypothetical protein
MLREALSRSRAVTDEAARSKPLGQRPLLVAGDAEQSEGHLSRRPGPGGEDPAGKEGNVMRIGQGFDVHALVPGRKLIVGGVEIPFERGLLGHSDADVLLHASPMPCSAPPASATSAGISPTAMRASRMPTAGSCCARRRG